MKTTKGGKVMNPTDAYRKELRRKELKRNKKERKKVREVGILKKDPDTIKEQIDKLEMMKADGALDKARKHKKRQLEDTLSLVLKKRKEYEEKMREKGEVPVMFSHLGPPRRRTAAEEEESINHPKAEDSVYYHPTLNPTGAPPPGKPPMFKSSIGPRVPLSASSDIASSSNTEAEDDPLDVPPPPPPQPPPPPPLPASSKLDDSALPSSLPLPPPPPAPPKPTAGSSVSFPPPPPGPPPKEPIAPHPSLPPPPPPPVLRPPPPPPSGANLRVQEDNKTAPDSQNLKVSDRATPAFPPPPPPPGLPTKSTNHPSETTPSESNSNNASGKSDISKMVPVLPPPPPGPPQMLPHRPPMFPSLQPDMAPPGIALFPLPPPVPGIPSRALPPPPPGVVAPAILRPAFAVPSGSSAMLRPVPAGIPPPQDDGFGALMPPASQKPSYVKSAASTVVKRPLAQHNPELTSMVPASVRIRRESALPKSKPKPQLPGAATAAAPRPSAPVVAGKPEIASTSSAPKAQSIDESYMAFLEDMKAMGALEE